MLGCKGLKSVNCPPSSNSLFGQTSQKNWHRAIFIYIFYLIHVYMLPKQACAYTPELMKFAISKGHKLFLKQSWNHFVQFNSNHNLFSSCTPNSINLKGMNISNSCYLSWQDNNYRLAPVNRHKWSLTAHSCACAEGWMKYKLTRVDPYITMKW